ncbi:peptidyl-tRNA hydrolase [Cylindrobasidium torrendii FP15055 ss-10]|uniref:peptidyl-tRNA hydrolase n=1 Tax=Cylindrobasidium torrendii FP15055 ss-10 TaxID=1314674 RepID=A0A0D7B8A4_9AGAR|nr:peptidyl-tRNA hydrolase [Cylindrobasidium torrendii FP15055 ss-10]
MSYGAPRLFIAGLGNLPFPSTRHSVGQLIVDALAARFGIQLSRDRRGFTGSGYVIVGKTPVSLTLFKSRDLMNISGRSVVTAYRQAASSPDAMIVLYDSLGHKPMKLSARLGGSAAGHNGVKSVVAALGGEANFWQFRAGIGREGQGDPSSYVLSPLPSEEIAFWKQQGLELVIREIEKVAKQLPE